MNKAFILNDDSFWFFLRISRSGGPPSVCALMVPKYDYWWKPRRLTCSAIGWSTHLTPPFLHSSDELSSRSIFTCKQTNWTNQNVSFSNRSFTKWYWFEHGTHNVSRCIVGETTWAHSQLLRCDNVRFMCFLQFLQS